ncbi:MAG: sugar ABC transporter permease [Chloroflexi bacterium]|nr:sugar ABC transporter permease [Chloroflexota bacterium]
MSVVQKFYEVKRSPRTSSPLISTLAAVTLLAPALFIMAAILGYPLLYNLGLAFTNRSLRHYYEYKFVGLANFVQLLNSREFYAVLSRTSLFTVFNVVLQIGVGLGLAVLLTSKRLRAPAIYRSLMIVPWVIPVYISVLVWRSMFLTDFGLINQFLSSLGLNGLPWLTSGELALGAIHIVQLWLAYPFVMTVSLGALQSVPPELYEAAMIDGAGTWSRFRLITWPLIRPAMLFIALLTGNTTFQLFIVVWFLTRGGPAGKTDLVMTWGYKTAFVAHQYGYQAAFMTVISIIVMIIATVIIRQGGLLRGMER